MSHISWGLAVAATISIFVIIGLIMADVVTRLFGISLPGIIELVRTSFVVSVFFAFAYVIVTEREIRVDVLRYVVPTFLLRYLDVAAALITFVFFGFMAWLAWVSLHDALTFGIFMDGELLLPMWLPWATIVIGSVAAMVAAACLAVRAWTSPVHKPDPTQVSAAARQVV
ncbi:TRAP transporter small permease [Enterovirga rhinocerotis]|uniref:TRAP transporter small permease n=1 Tax=Enterovirga rhinocerotis TaxID=1339210 RepID=UPI00141509D7|nr:TRAP transporter small permease [Enterovirga rhinocerotis]